MPLWLDMPGDTTVSRVDSRSVSIRTTCHDKGRFTVILAAMADGRKLKAFNESLFSRVFEVAHSSLVSLVWQWLLVATAG